MKNQINLKDGETLTRAIYENGSGVPSLVLYAETIAHARPVAHTSVVYPTREDMTIMEIERMGYAARYAFNIADE